MGHREDLWEEEEEAPSGVPGLLSSPSLECSQGFLHSQPSRRNHPQKPHARQGPVTHIH